MTFHLAQPDSDFLDELNGLVIASFIQRLRRATNVIPGQVALPNTHGRNLMSTRDEPVYMRVEDEYILGTLISPGTLLPGVLLLTFRFRAQILPPTRRERRVARSKREHLMLLFRHDGPLDFHWRQLRDILILISTLARRVHKICRGRKFQPIPAQHCETCRNRS